ncbi:hypothetical protein MsAg5_14380 [Methanosarcinaceae archaeon Ag5]|uniref:DUF2110 family protein n=1 Tax=Methanolapillus africanus TaxID=3028297 RepID=A0AAE4MKX7_9EURY|nr:hypothetical protein [Methanosarcinaceae archaeon Ag5]
MIIELLQPVYGHEENAKKSLKAFMDEEFKDLDVAFEILSPKVAGKKHLSVMVSGDDEEVSANFLYNAFGKPLQKSDAVPGETYKGFISKIEPDQITVDIGFDAIVSAMSLSTLGAGNAGQIAARFGMIPYLPVTVTIPTGSVPADELWAVGKVNFSKEQIDLWWTWKKSSTDRIFLNNATRSQVKAALKKKRHGRDVYGVERLGLMECVVICNEKTDGPGIVASIGKLLPSQMGVLLADKKSVK